MPRPTSKDVRKLIICHRQQGRSINDIASIVGVSSRTVLNIIKQYHERGTVSPCKSSGRPQLTACHDDAYLIRKVWGKPFQICRNTTFRIRFIIFDRHCEKTVSMHLRYFLTQTGDLHSRLEIIMQIIICKNSFLNID